MVQRKDEADEAEDGDAEMAESQHWQCVQEEKGSAPEEVNEIRNHCSQAENEEVVRDGGEGEAVGVTG